jgi:hypothetical protein
MLAPYRREMLRDLERGPDEEALSMMFDYWNCNTDKIANAKNLFGLAIE